MRYKKDCKDECTKCKPVDFETYQGFSDAEKDSETQKGNCRCRQTVDRITAPRDNRVPEGHSTVITEWHHNEAMK